MMHAFGLLILCLTRYFSFKHKDEILCKTIFGEKHLINLPFFGSKSNGRTFLVESTQGNNSIIHKGVGDYNGLVKPDHGKLSKINREGEDYKGHAKSEYGGDYNENSEGNSKGLQHKVYSELQVLGACWAS